MLPSRRLYIRNLPLYFDKKDKLIEVFGKYGTIAECYFTGKDDGVVTYFDLSHAITARTEEIKKELDINFEQDATSDDDAIRISIKGQRRISETTIESVFGHHGRILKVTSDKHNNMYVKYFDVRDVEIAITKEDGRTLDGAEMSVTRAKQRLPKPKKKEKTPPPASPKKKRTTPPPVVVVATKGAQGGGGGPISWDQLTRDVLNLTTDVILDDTPVKRQKYVADLKDLLKQIE